MTQPKKCYTQEGKPLMCPSCHSTHIFASMTDYDDLARVSFEEISCEDCGEVIGAWDNGEWDKSFANRQESIDTNHSYCSIDTSVDYLESVDSLEAFLTSLGTTLTESEIHTVIREGIQHFKLSETQISWLYSFTKVDAPIEYQMSIGEDELDELDEEYYHTLHLFDDPCYEDYL